MTLTTTIRDLVELSIKKDKDNFMTRNTFRLNIIVKSNIISAIVEFGSGSNLISKGLIEKLGLDITFHQVSML